MPAARLSALAVCLSLSLAGCATSRYGDMLVSAASSSRSEPVRLPRDPARPPTGEATLAYWTGLKAASVKGTGDTEEIRDKFRRSARELQKLPVIGVDPELVEKVLVLAREEQNLARLSQFVHDGF